MDTLFTWCAIIGGTVLAIQTLLTVVGIGMDDVDTDAAFHGDVADAVHHGVFGVLSLKAVVAFTTFFGLSGLAAHRGGYGTGVSLGVAIAAGVASMWIVASLMRGLAKLQSEGNLDLHNAVGEFGEVYVRVPGERQGIGRIRLNVQGRRIECKAMTAGTELTRGTQVRVLELHGNDVLVVAATT